MNHGYNEDDLDFPSPQAGPSGFLASLMGGMGGMGARYGRPPPAHLYDDYFKAFSVATMAHGHERPQLMYGGKIIMPPSALAKLTSLDIEGPWTFQLRNPRNPQVNQTHAGVLEFIAEEGVVHLPAWMMKTLNLNEGDPVRLTGAALPKGKRVKIQAQSVDFLEVTDPKAVLESALRTYSALSKGDIIEISYTSHTFEFLVMETLPEGPGISIIDTDLEVDFETPVGYVEPPRPAPAPIPTMADKLKIDLGGKTLASQDSSRPVSSASIRTQGSGDGAMESFMGVGHSLSGRKVKGKGLAKKIEEVDPSSKINRFTGPRVITTDSLDQDRQVPAALVLPAGKFFFGYKYIPFDEKADAKRKRAKEVAKGPAPPVSFQGEGNSLSRRGRASQPAAQAEPAPADEDEEKPDPWANLGSGNTLSGHKRRAAASPSPASTPAPRNPTREEVIDSTMLDEDDFMFGEEYDEYDEDDYISVDSD